MNDSFKKISTFLVLVSGLALIFELPYIRNSFYVPICQALNLNNQEFGVLSSIYSTVSLVMYVAGGFLSDRLNSRWLLFLPFAGTGILGFWFSRFPDYGELKIIFALMGITTVMTFFPHPSASSRTWEADTNRGGYLDGWRPGRGFSQA